MKESGVIRCFVHYLHDDVSKTVDPDEEKS